MPIDPSGIAPEARNPQDMDLKALLRTGDAAFWPALCERSWTATKFEDLAALSTLRKRANASKANGAPGLQVPLRVAMVGGCSLFPLHGFVEHMLAVSGYAAEMFIGRYDNYASELLDPASELYAFAPDVLFVIPSHNRCRYEGQLSDPRDLQQAQISAVSSQLLEMCRLAHERTGAEVLLSNFMLPAGFDPGPYRTRSMGSEWTFRKAVNLELGLNAPSSVHICDLEFLAYRRGGVASADARAWFESKQPCSADLLVDIAREIATMVRSLKSGSKKVLVLDLDNTLWGGVVGDDGLEGIEIGDTSPRAEAFKSFQKCIAGLARRGVLLAVCSKNDYEKAAEPFLKHPEMALRMEDFSAFKANWNPKSENIRQIAADLNLGLDSLVFVDDNPAEIDIVRQFVPAVTTILLGPDPAGYVAQLQDSRLFEPRSITAEDAQRTAQYRQEAERKTLLASSTDMGAYLASLGMTATIKEFDAVDAPRISQLINKSNQFNLTTRRRTEAEVLALARDPDYVTFTVRLQDRFGDHGLIAVVAGRVEEDSALEVDTWLMSCRVLNRQVEEETLNELVRLATGRGCRSIRGLYLPTAKNGMVRGLYPKLGFQVVLEQEDRAEWALDVASFQPFTTKIDVLQRAHDANRHSFEAAANL